MRTRPRPRTKLHFHPAHFIKLSAPLVWILLPGTRKFVAQDYTRLRRVSQFEIFIVPIDFSDAFIIAFNSTYGEMLQAAACPFSTERLNRVCLQLQDRLHLLALRVLSEDFLAMTRPA
jgi:hypothetical protein